MVLVPGTARERPNPRWRALGGGKSDHGERRAVNLEILPGEESAPARNLEAGAGPDLDPPETPAAHARDRRVRALLLLAALIGIGAAALSLTGGAPRPAALPADAVALVNGRSIGREYFESLLLGFAGDRRDGALPPGERARVLGRLVDEELLLERALELDLPRTDPIVRRELVASLVRSISVEGDTATPDDQALRTFFTSNAERFAVADRIAARALFFRVDDSRDDAAALDLARTATARARGGEELEAIRRTIGDPLPVPLPAEALPPAKLRDYLGPTATQALSSLAVHQVSDPVRGNGGYYVLQVTGREQSRPARFEEVRDQVLAEYRREAGEDAVERYIAGLRRAATIATREASEPRPAGAPETSR
jgi:hypothetical protein